MFQNFAWSNMHHTHENQKCIFLISILCFIMGSNCGVIVKNKMCRLYEFNNYESNGTTIIKRLNGMTKPQCMLSCVGNNSCTAFHFRAKDGNCELLKTVKECMSHDITMGTTFVQLAKCDGTAPWKVMSQRLEKLQWKDPGDIGGREVVWAKIGQRYVARVLYKGIYLTGFFRGKTLFVVDMNGKLIRCSTLAQVLTCADPSDYSWSEYERGEPIPSSAVVGGYAQDGTPLYVANIKLTDWKPSYYNARTEKFYVNYMGSRVKKARILIEI